MAAIQTKLLSICLLRRKVLQTGLRLASTVPSSSFKYEDLEVTLTNTPQPKPDDNNLIFGHHFSDHMLTVDWTAQTGWSKPVIHPVEEMRIHPAAKVLHYAVELFEGVKAYRCEDGKVRVFRPMENMKRMRSTAERSALPDFDGDELCKCIKKLISIDSAWVPRSDRCSLYIRPTFIGTEPTLGVVKSNAAKLFVLIGPVGPYYPTGFKPVTLLADPQYVRAWPGGCGAYKMGANYAPTIQIQDTAVKEEGCQQVLWLYGEDHMMTEVGTMNLFVYLINEKGEEELVTPPLNGLILPGVTRKSLLELAREWNEFKVSERDIKMKEFVKALNERRIKEVFGAGTACLVSPVEGIKYQGQHLVIPTMETAVLTNRFNNILMDIQYGRTPHRWMEPVDEEGQRMQEVSRV
ncbi:branched-chain-amino-acid aminotransferase, cytosolic-like isoform X1 [Littorina saxatilis]|uniref:Branched-chain-amino-acid aminotransferase n=1 Tax=Littorina saxatilis TaxID=31220 RepID=A0AAN9G8H7_9CAEN